jgi:hypothetical protein
MKRFVEGIDRGQATLFPECLEDWIDADSPVRVIDAFVEKLDGFRWSGSRGNRPTFISPRCPAEALHLRLRQSGPVEPTA